jgi:hypothetical protein
VPNLGASRGRRFDQQLTNFCALQGPTNPIRADSSPIPASQGPKARPLSVCVARRWPWDESIRGDLLLKSRGGITELESPITSWYSVFWRKKVGKTIFEQICNAVPELCFLLVVPTCVLKHSQTILLVSHSSMLVFDCSVTLLPAMPVLSIFTFRLITLPGSRNKIWVILRAIYILQPSWVPKQN